MRYAAISDAVADPLITAGFGFLGAIVGAIAIYAQGKSATRVAELAAKAAVQQAKESAGGTVFDSGAARNAEFQQLRRDR
ncbi:MAG TPA: hypothetical protein VNS49_06600, partial [Streptomyces sp.]|nr:hypothetical protein [Streptomyces sp.]